MNNTFRDDIFKKDVISALFVVGRPLTTASEFLNSLWK